MKERAALDAAYARGDRPWCCGRRDRAGASSVGADPARRRATCDRIVACSARTATTSPSAPAARCWRCAARTRVSGSTRSVLTGGGTAREEEERAALAAFCPGADLRLTVLELPDGRVPAHWERGQARARGAARARRAGSDPRAAHRRRAPGPPRPGEAGAHRVPRPPRARLRDRQVGRRPRPPDRVPAAAEPVLAEEKVQLLHEHYPLAAATGPGSTGRPSSALPGSAASSATRATPRRSSRRAKLQRSRASDRDGSEKPCAFC